MAKYRVTIGREFELGGVEIKNVKAVERLAVIDERRRYARQQARLTYGVLGVMLVAVAVTAFIGWRDGSYNELNAVWATGSIWVGVVLGRYFKKD
jgi:hypothetical protein